MSEEMHSRLSVYIENCLSHHKIHVAKAKWKNTIFSKISHVLLPSQEYLLPVMTNLLRIALVECLGWSLHLSMHHSPSWEYGSNTQRQPEKWLFMKSPPHPLLLNQPKEVLVDVFYRPRVPQKQGEEQSLSSDLRNAPPSSDTGEWAGSHL